ncbi:DNA topoisomerase I [Candidatus Daviesbacteria bacterium RIFCSPHIGHO2_02_FULL_36_13]|uniref:DNA topoisomerase 1 n=1 Tax=Candidatus Daviesbacteria bacterium RIFCSPHIGHO2_02_FULL_36_13 TaxID=1797768 RepID=A0A1F5JWD9_9BACT|nr:MAG: DNA topoisomerase I [Candidatus Daviesbacteria bacterium RIFCSPHIGHO2_02_FULL_36_13]
MNNLVIVESPTKARTLSKFLGDQYQIEASMGHIRDLPKSDLGVDIENNFEPQYVIPRDKRKHVNQLIKLSEKADQLWLATDPDREGEAIAWHLGHILSGKKIPVKRVVFHEITEEAIKDAFDHPRDLDLKLVDAQQARRVLDRLVGYKLSPLLWTKIKKGLSAGRVQSVALRLIVEREKEVKAFKAIEYWSITAELLAEKSKFIATLIEKDSKKIEIKNEKEAKEHVTNLEKSKYVVSKVTKKEVRRFPYAPFTTSTLQQTSANKLGYSAKKTMMLAQNLYEHGLITYMRTDSVNLSASSISQVRTYIGNFINKFESSSLKGSFQDSLIGKSYLPKSPRVFKSKSKNAQEAHEAIRVTNVSLKGEDVAKQNGLNRDHGRLYDLIWKRFVACQMNEAVMDQTTIDVIASETKQSYLLRATGSVIKFDGWLKLYGKDTEEEDEEEKKQVLPKVSENQNLNLDKILPSQHFTEPPPRYTEASLIKKLEELGIGRPSTYAPILSTIQERYYVEKQERKFSPTVLGISVMDFLLKYFPDVFDYQFTAAMEDQLDEISRGEREWKPILKSFYDPFEKKIIETEKVADKVKMEVEKVDRQCPDCGKDLIVRYGKFGKFLACSGFPDCKHTEALDEPINAKCPEDGGAIVVRHTKRGKTFYGCKNWPTCKYASWNKPKSEEKPKEIVDTKA